LFSDIIFLALLSAEVSGEGVTLISELRVGARGISQRSRASHCTGEAGGQ